MATGLSGNSPLNHSRPRRHSLDLPNMHQHAAEQPATLQFINPFAEEAPEDRFLSTPIPITHDEDGVSLPEGRLTPSPFTLSSDSTDSHTDDSSDGITAPPSTPASNVPTLFDMIDRALERATAGESFTEETIPKVWIEWLEWYYAPPKPQDSGSASQQSPETPSNANSSLTSSTGFPSISPRTPQNTQHSPTSVASLGNKRNAEQDAESGHPKHTRTMQAIATSQHPAYG